MKSILAVFLLACLVMPFAACGDDDTDLSAPAEEEPVNANPVNAVEKAKDARDIQEEADELRGQQVEEQLEGYDSLP